MWNDRYRGADYVFGTAPANFLTRAAPRLTPGQTALCLADGEGRNSVYLAELGLHVTAMDAAENAVSKARALAKARGVSVDFHVAEIAAWDWAQYDVVVGIFIQFAPPALRDVIFAQMIRAVKPGGLLLLHGYSTEQMSYSSGGPRAVENLYALDLLADRFAALNLLELRAYTAQLNEGTGHCGPAALIDLIAQKPR